MVRSTMMMLVVAILAATALGQSLFTPNFPCLGSRQYNVTIDYNWSGASHPESYPDNGGFSPIGIVTHNPYTILWAQNGYASLAVQDVAETGNFTIIGAVVDILIGNGVFDAFVTDGPASGTSTVSTTIFVNRGRPYMTAITMIVPSPDWFTGFNSVNLCDEATGLWKSFVRGPLIPYDAGSDAGQDFNSPDQPTNFTLPIQNNFARFQNIPLGTYTLRLITPTTP